MITNFLLCTHLSVVEREFKTVMFYKIIFKYTYEPMIL